MDKKYKSLLKIKVSEETLMDAEQIYVGGYAPLKGFMLKPDSESVINKMRLTDGQVWSLPIILDVDKKTADSIKAGDEILLVDKEGNPMVLMAAEEIYPYDKFSYCKLVYGTEDTAHPGVAKTFGMQDMLIGGRVIKILNLYFSPVRKSMLSPEETKAYFQKKGWKTICAFHTRNIVHRAHEYLQRCAMEITDGVFIHPVAGVTKAGDFKKEVIIKAYHRLIESYYPKNKAFLAALGISMRFAGPREAVFHALIRKNYGCTHIIIGRDHAGAGGYYNKYAAHKIFSELPSLGITPLLFKGPFYCKKCESMVTENTCAHDEDCRSEVSGTLVRKLIKERQKLPKWLVRPEIADLFEGFGEGTFC